MFLLHVITVVVLLAALVLTVYGFAVAGKEIEKRVEDEPEDGEG